MKVIALAGLMLLLAVASTTTVAADVLITDTTVLTGDLGIFDLISQVSQSGSVYTYQYTLYYRPGTGTGATAHIFSVENIDDVAWTGASNDLDFTNPTYAPGAFEVKWIDGNMVPGNTVIFAYSSSYAPNTDIRSYSYVVDSGSQADGYSVGMGSMVPEPGSLMGLALGIGAIVPFIRRARK